MPDWVGSAQGWSKLNAVQSWLRHEAALADEFWVVEGHLQMAEGRLAVNNTSGTDRSRAQAVRADFEYALASDAATAGQRERARRGLDRLGAATPTPVAGNALPAGILPRRAWGARTASPRRMDRANGNWRYLTIHHSAMEGEGRLTGDPAQSHESIQRIQSAHMSGEGFGDIGYHFLVDPAGRIYQGRDLRYQGAHAGGNNNVGNIGICLLGNFDQVRPTRAALAALDRLVATFGRQFNISAQRIKGHGDWKNTQCPGHHLTQHIRSYR